MALSPEDSEYAKEYEDREPELANMSLEEFDEMRTMEDNGDTWSPNDDDDSYDNC